MTQTETIILLVIFIIWAILIVPFAALFSVLRKKEICVALEPPLAAMWPLIILIMVAYQIIAVIACCAVWIYRKCEDFFNNLIDK